MDIQLKSDFIDRWNHYFPGSSLPIVFFYTGETGEVELASPPEGTNCLICHLQAVREGKSLAFHKDNLRCGGARRSLGFSPQMGPNFKYFLSCGLPGEVEGERYKQSPELVEAYLKNQKTLEAPEEYIVFKRWDALEPDDEPAVVIFYASPDELSGLFTLASFDESEPDGVIAPFGSGCSTIVQAPYLEGSSARPRAVLGMFDVSARPCVPGSQLTFSIPWSKFTRMLNNMDESFLITHSWQRVQPRLHPAAEKTDQA